MYIIRLIDLQQHLGRKIGDDLKVEYVNFSSEPNNFNWSLIPPYFTYKVEKIISGKFVASQTINFYLGLENSNYKSLLVWFNNENKKFLVDRYLISEDLFVEYQPKANTTDKSNED